MRIAKYPKFGKVTVALVDSASGRLVRQSLVEMRQSNGVSLLQLDKPIYTPDQQVKMRMLRLDKHLKPFRDEFRIQIIVSGKFFL